MVSKNHNIHSTQNEIFQSSDSVGIPSICLVEIVYLVEKQRVPDHTLDLLQRELRERDKFFVVVPLDEQIALRVADIDRATVPELPDRVIAATALHLGVPLITRDHKIHASGIETIW
ncbi:MAG: PIN domain-containing protein [Chloroflexi bacterium]|nr:PIN domain-containing protein [Chloroflexota bacterium]